MTTASTTTADSQDTLNLRQPERGTGAGLMAQMNPAPGDLAGNAQHIITAMRDAEARNADWVAFPELALMGYPVGDVIVRHPFLVTENIKWLNALAEKSQETRALVGFVEPCASHPKLFYNSVAILGKGHIEGIVRKSLLPTYTEFYDHRTFQPASQPGVWPAKALGLQEGFSPEATIEIHEKTYAISICEDIWNNDDFFDHRRHTHDPIETLMAATPDIHINLSASPSRNRKLGLKQAMLSHLSETYNTPLVYVNQVGAIDEISFDGGSMVFDAQGELVAHAPLFEATTLWVSPLEATKPLDLKPIIDPKIFDPTHARDLERTYKTLVQGIRDYFKKTGFKRALLGLSGGLDSAVTVTLLVDALGKDNVLGVLMPSRLTSNESANDAQALADNLGIETVTLPISQAVDALTFQTTQAHQGLKPHWGAPNPHSFAADNAQAISRATLLRLLGNDYGALPIATSDKSECYLGYATVDGDMSGALAPLGDVVKTKVRALAHWMNENRDTKNALPKNVIAKPSGAELAIDPATGKTLTAEDALMPYVFADEIIWRIEVLGQSLNQMHTETFVYETENTLSTEQKTLWLEKFFKRMSQSVFKWWLLPPCILLAGNGSITKTDYRHPITANRIVWQGHSEVEINTLLGRNK